MRSNSDFTHLRAAPMPRVSEVVSESVFRVPKEALKSIGRALLQGVLTPCENSHLSWYFLAMYSKMAALVDLRLVLPEIARIRGRWIACQRYDLVQNAIEMDELRKLIE